MFRLKSFLGLLATSKLSILGAVLVTTAIGADAMLIVGELLIFESNPYIGIVAYVLFPGIAAFGLVLIPAGIGLHIRKAHRANRMDALVSRLKRKHVLRLILSLTMVNFVIFAFVGYRSLHYVESAEFCGLVCHQVMKPEYTAYKRSPHAEIHCVDCHVGSGPGWFIKSKLDGTRQLAGVLLENYARPIETPIHNLRPAKDVCQVCHSPESYQGNRIKVIERYASNEANTRTFTVLNFLLGAAKNAKSGTRGIHWHSRDDHEIRYTATDHRREKVTRVELISEDGGIRVWTRTGVRDDQQDSQKQVERVMDCVDCHNRPAHQYFTPENALDGALASSSLDASTPWIRLISFELITKEYASQDEAMDAIGNLPDLYKERYPDNWSAHEKAIVSAVPVLQEIYRTNVYPAMKIAWNTYPSLLGHVTPHTSACFRCHDGGLVDELGVQITTDCTACHFVLAEDEQDPVILRMLEDR